MKEEDQGRRIDSEVLKSGNGDEAGEEHGQKPGVGIIDAQEEDGEADEEKESRKEAGEVVSRSDRPSLDLPGLAARKMARRLTGCGWPARRTVRSTGSPGTEWLQK